MKATLGDIVLEARELFRNHGYDGASMQDLAGRVGLKKASLYTRFPSKEALVPEVLAVTQAETFAGLPRPGGDWRADYGEVVERIAGALTAAKRCVGMHLAYGVSDETPEARAAVQAFFTGQRDRIAAILAPGLGAEEAQLVAADTLARLEGATLWLATTGDARPMRRAVEALVAAQAAG
jgi:AcrR family transcriptional regulator